MCHCERPVTLKGVTVSNLICRMLRARHKDLRDSLFLAVGQIHATQENHFSRMYDTYFSRNAIYCTFNLIIQRFAGKRTYCQARVLILGLSYPRTTLGIEYSYDYKTVLELHQDLRPINPVPYLNLAKIWNYNSSSPRSMSFG